MENNTLRIKCGMMDVNTSAHVTMLCLVSTGVQTGKVYNDFIRGQLEIVISQGVILTKTPDQAFSFPRE